MSASLDSAGKAQEKASHALPANLATFLQGWVHVTAVLLASQAGQKQRHAQVSCSVMMTTVASVLGFHQCCLLPFDNSWS
jgi:hypothetical protein